ncbi:MAG: hypothetical protein IJU40_07680 [Desulfovibrionaceae bacterium]|nr:hypothetical protein [Desulfovibrionaceae bacterium]
MVANNLLNEILKDHRIPDHPKMAAYEHISPKFRTILKQALAWHSWSFKILYPSLTPSHHLNRLSYALESENQGLGYKITRRPLDWLTLVIEADYKATARLTAAAILPLLCGIKNIYAVFLEDLPPEAALLSLELTGLEESLIMPKNSLEAFLNSLPGNGGILALTNSLPTSCAKWLLFQESAPPRICLHYPELFDTKLLHFLHGEVEFNFSLDLQTDLLITSKAEAQNFKEEQSYQRLLLVTPGCEGYWRYINLNPQIFCQEQETLFLLES